MSVAERRTRLVDAAITVMSRDGIAHTTTRSIVAEAGMQIGVFHYCFRSKEELVLEVMKTISDRSFEAVAAVLEAAPPGEELIDRCLAAYWDHIQENPLEHLLTYELTQYALRQPGQEDAAREQYHGYISGMEGFLAAAAAVGGFSWATPIDVLARLVLAVVEGVTIQWLVIRDDDMAAQLLDQLADRLYRDSGLQRQSLKAG